MSIVLAIARYLLALTGGGGAAVLPCGAGASSSITVLLSLNQREWDYLGLAAALSLDRYVPANPDNIIYITSWQGSSTQCSQKNPEGVQPSQQEQQWTSSGSSSSQCLSKELPRRAHASPFQPPQYSLPPLLTTAGMMRQ